MIERPSHRSQRGMTLVEVMMVVFIIGLASGVVVLTMPPRATPEQVAATTFADTLEQAQERAILSGQAVGLNLTDTGYKLVEWRSQNWQTISNEETLGRWMSLTLRDAPDQADPSGRPAIIFDPTGVGEVAAFDLRGRGRDFIITVQADGRVSTDAS